MPNPLPIFLPVLLSLAALTACAPPAGESDYLLSFTDPGEGDCGYKNQSGEVVIPAGKYTYCFTDTFSTYAIVLDPDAGMVAIDRQEQVLYQVFPYDNGPDYPAGGLFRIVEDGKIGYADAETGAVVIKPQFPCAYPFEGDVAKVSTDCATGSDGEHQSWTSDNWYYIDRAGKPANQPNGEQ